MNYWWEGKKYKYEIANECEGWMDWWSQIVIMTILR